MAIARPLYTRAMHTSRVNAAERLIVALDFPEIEKAKQFVSKLDGTASHFKVGYHLQLVRGYDDLVNWLIDSGKQVMLDTKVMDITETVRAAVAGAAGRGASFLTIHGNGEVSDQALTAAVEAKGNSSLGLLLITVLTHLDDLDLQSIGYGGKSVHDVVIDRTNRALKFGFDGVVSSGWEAHGIRELPGARNLLVVAPGIRPAGSPRQDQKRVMTPSHAIASGADYLVVGRPIIASAEPAGAAQRIIEEMQAAFDER